MKSAPPIGTLGRLERVVTPDRAIHLAAGQPDAVRVFATPHLVDLMEHAARRALEPFLDPGEETVGVSVQVEHLAATPVGAAVRAEARVTAVEGKLIDFQIDAHDAHELIGRATHRRAVIRMEKFAPRVAAKPAPPAPPERLPELRWLRFSQTGPLARLTLARPEKVNAKHRPLSEELAAVRAWLAAHPEDVRVVLLSGEGKHFCAGDDVAELARLTPDEALALDTLRAANCVELTRLPQVFVAAIRGYCLGGGLMLAAHCDYRLAASDAVFGLPEILLGWPPAYGNARIVQLVGQARALDLSLTGRQIPAAQALASGLIDRVVPGARLESEAERLAADLLARPPVALRETKLRLHAVAAHPTADSHLDDLAAYRRCLDTPEARAALAAFGRKR